MMVSFAPGGYISAIAAHMPLRWASAISSALSGRHPRTFSVELGDLNGKAGRHKRIGSRLDIWEYI